MSNVINFPSRQPPKPERPPHPADALSFLKRRRTKGGGINYWLVDRTGNYREQCERGEQLALEYLAFIGKHPCPGSECLLPDIVRSMIERAEQGDGWTGVHIGFLWEVSRYVMAMAVSMHEEAGE